MRFFISSRLRPKVTPERFLEYIRRQGMVDWSNFKNGVLLYPHYRIGPTVGILGFVEAKDEPHARAILAQSPLALLVEFDIEPVCPIALFE